MSSRAERRAALAAARSTDAEGPDEPKEDEPMKIRYATVLFEMTIRRLTGSTGLASSDTAFFQAENGLSIELNTASQIVTLRKGDVVKNVPVCRVLEFGPEVTAG